MLAAHNSWLRYFTELSTKSLITLDAKANDVQGDGARTSVSPDQEMDFEAALQETLAEYGATRDRLEMLEKKLEKMLEIKETKVRSDYEMARRNLELLEREGSVIRQIIAGTPTKMGDDDDITVKAERAGISSFQFQRMCKVYRDYHPSYSSSLTLVIRQRLANERLALPWPCARHSRYA